MKSNISSRTHTLRQIIIWYITFIYFSIFCSALHNICVMINSASWYWFPRLWLVIQTSEKTKWLFLLIFFCFKIFFSCFRVSTHTHFCFLIALVFCTLFSQKNINEKIVWWKTFDSALTSKKKEHLQIGYIKINFGFYNFSALSKWLLKNWLWS